jgi:hypothetical protein
VYNIYVSEKMIPAETIPGMGGEGGEVKETSTGGEFKCI